MNTINEEPESQETSVDRPNKYHRKRDTELEYVEEELVLEQIGNDDQIKETRISTIDSDKENYDHNDIMPELDNFKPLETPNGKGAFQPALSEEYAQEVFEDDIELEQNIS